MMSNFKFSLKPRNKETTKMLDYLPSVQSVFKTKSKPTLHKLNRLGGGTYGRVYQARTYKDGEKDFVQQPGAMIAISEDNSDEEIVAVKRNFIAPALNQTIGSLRELDMLNLAKKHPFCVGLKNISFEMPFSDGALSPADRNWVSDKVYFVLEKGQCDGDNYIRGHQIIPGITPPLVNERKLFIMHVLLAVEFLHSRGVYHRDIKPANIICFKDAQQNLTSAKLTDFGLSQYYCSQSMSSSGFVTLWYRAPEISLAKEYDYKADLWSLGCVLFELFASLNQRFLQASNDEQLINKIIEKVPFPEEWYELAQQLYPRKITRNYRGLQKSQLSLKQQMAYTESQISQFNSSQLGGNPNFGSFEELVDLLGHMLVVDPKERWSCSQCLNHTFFDGSRELIDQTRLNFGINRHGQWVTAPPASLNYVSSETRARGMQWFQILYSHRSQMPMVQWYTHRIFFHAIEMFDRYLLLTQKTAASQSEIVIWVNTFAFMSAKYFRVLTTDLGLNAFSVGIIPDEFGIFQQRAQEFEEHVVSEVFKCEIYRSTIYEEAEDFLSENAVAHFVKLFIDAAVPSGVRLKTLWHNQSHAIGLKNRQRSPVAASTTPVVSMVNY